MARGHRTTKLTWGEVWPVWATMGAVFVIGAFGVWFYVPAVAAVRRLPPGEDGVIPVAKLPSETAVLFSAPLPSGVTVDFFVQRDPSNSISVAFSSCRRCYREGHYSQAGQIFCKHCKQPMPRLAVRESITLENDCKHIPLPFEVSAGTVRVQAKAIADAYSQWFVPVLTRDTATVAGGGK